MSDQKVPVYKKFIPPAVAAAVFLFGYFVWPNGIVFPAIAFVASWVLAYAVVHPRPGAPTVRRIGPGTAAAAAIADSGVDPNDYENTLKLAQSRLQEFRNLAFRIGRMEVRAVVDGIADATGRIIDEVRRDPKDLRAAYQFFGYYQDASLKILKRYVELAADPVPSDETRAAMERVEGEFPAIRAGFEKQLSVLRENDMIDLDVELTVLKKTIEMEGLGAPPGARD